MNKIILLITLAALSNSAMADPQKKQSDSSVLTNGQLSQAASQVPAQVGAKLSGTITYFFNDNYGNKPDTGTKVCLIQASPNFTLHSTDTVFIALQKSPQILVMQKTKESNSFPVIYSFVTDGNGRYEMSNIKPGKYILIFQSSHTRGMDQLNIIGKVFTELIEVGSGDSREVSNDFGTTAF
jgi:hypothetical protein